MDIIHQLPDTVANQIAAGEVIQRPASVIKELVENAVDAGAKRIDVIVVDAGRTSIQVIDDGKGMSPTDARMAFERHATSKILQAMDLYNLHTMGFRGEAVPSVAAVAQVTLRTRTKDDELGTCLINEGGTFVSQEADACPVGTNFLVQNLFFNMPARRKFLKSNNTEFSNIVHEFERIALVNPQIHFTLTHGDNLVTDLPVSNLRQRIVNVFGKRIGDQMLEVDVATSLCHLYGFVGKPESARKKGAHQYFFVNNRYMRHPYFHKAVQEAFNGIIAATEQVPYFLYFEVNPQDIDVNIHPTKTEIKFENEAAIWQVIIAAVKQTLGRFNAVPVIDFDAEDRPDMPVFDATAPSPTFTPAIDVDLSYNPFKSGGGGGSKSSGPTESPTRQRSATVSDWDLLYQGLEKHGQAKSDMNLMDVEDEPMESSLFTPEETEAMEKSSQHFQYHGRFIITSVRTGLMIVDQHRAHIRVLYDRYREQLRQHTATSQGLLFPEMIQLPASSQGQFEQMLDTLHTLGFDITALGGGSYSVSGVPAGTDGVNIQQLLLEMVATQEEKTTDVGDLIHHRVALTLARNTAISTGEYLTNEQMEHLVSELFATTNPSYTPDGRVVVTIFREEDMLKMF